MHPQRPAILLHGPLHRLRHSARHLHMNLQRYPRRRSGQGRQVLDHFVREPPRVPANPQRVERSRSEEAPQDLLALRNGDGQCTWAANA